MAIQKNRYELMSANDSRGPQRMTAGDSQRPATIMREQSKGMEATARGREQRNFCLRGIVKRKASSALLLLPLLLFCCLVSRNPVAGSQTFRSVPTTVKTYENETVLLPCYHNAPYRYVRWSRDDLLLVDSRYPELKAPPRVRLWRNGSLEVADVQTEDTGDYICEIMTDGGRATQSHAIEVQYPATVTVFPSGKIVGQVGQILEIICQVTGVPLPFVTWNFRNENVSAAFENELKLSAVIEDRTFSGPVECVANNGVGDPVVATVDLIVYFVPEIEIKNHTVHTKIGQNTVLECLVTSQPLATIHWFRNGQPVLLDRRIAKLDTIISMQRYHTVKRHALVLRNLRDSDLGRYECKAVNSLGFSSAQLELTGRPMAASFKPSTEMSSSTTHGLIWQTESFSPIIEYKLKFRRVPSGNVTPNRRFPYMTWNELIIPSDGSSGTLHSTGYTLQGLLPKSVYEVIILSRNRYGWSDSSNIMRFATGGEVEIDEGNEPVQTTETIEYTEQTLDGTGTAFITDNTIPSDYYDYITSSNGAPRTTVGIVALLVYLGMVIVSLVK